MNNSKKRRAFRTPLPKQVGGLKGSHYKQDGSGAIPPASPGSKTIQKWSARKRKGPNKEIGQWVASTRVSV